MLLSWKSELLSLQVCYQKQFTSLEKKDTIKDQQESVQYNLGEKERYFRTRRCTFCLKIKVLRVIDFMVVDFSDFLSISNHIKQT